MSARRPQSPMVRLFGTLLPRMLFLTAPLALAACSGTSTPLAPENLPSSPNDYAGGIGQRPVVGRIAFTSYRNDVTSKGDIYLMNPDGSNLTRLTSGADDESGRYTPTANASEGTPDISSVMAIITPSSTSPHGSWRLRMPLMM